MASYQRTSTGASRSRLWTSRRVTSQTSSPYRTRALPARISGLPSQLLAPGDVDPTPEPRYLSRLRQTRDYLASGRTYLPFRLYNYHATHQLTVRIWCCLNCQTDDHTTRNCTAIPLDMSNLTCERQSCGVRFRQVRLGHVTTRRRVPPVPAETATSRATVPTSVLNSSSVLAAVATATSPLPAPLQPPTSNAAHATGLVTLPRTAQTRPATDAARLDTWPWAATSPARRSSAMSSAVGAARGAIWPKTARSLST